MAFFVQSTSLITSLDVSYLQKRKCFILLLPDVSLSLPCWLSWFSSLPYFNQGTLFMPLALLDLKFFVIMPLYCIDCSSSSMNWDNYGRPDKTKLKYMALNESLIMKVSCLHFLFTCNHFLLY